MRRISILVSVFVALFALTGCGESHSWRQKTTLEVETPGGVVTGGGVTEMNVHWFGAIDRALSAGNAVNEGMRGEASFVEVAEGRYLFALLKDGEAWRATEMFAKPEEKRKLNLTTARLEHMTEIRTLPPSQYPQLVTFDDITKPETVKLVDPANIAATFGEGYALKSMQLEITDEKATEGKVEKVLGWIKERNPVFLENWKDFPADHPLRNISKFSFKTGE